MANYDYLLKLLICGDSGTGKSCLMRRYVNDEFNVSDLSTIGIDFKIHTINFKGKRIKLQIWDAAGQERFRTVIANYYKGTHGLLIVTDYSEGSQGCLEWYERFRNDNQEAPILLAINKSDLRDLGVYSDILRNPLEEYSVPMIAVSAKTGSNVNNAFMTLIDMIFTKNPEAGRQEAVQNIKPPDFLVHYEEHKPEDKKIEEVPNKIQSSNENPCCCEII
jgi:small GTP-binding protein